MDVDFAEHFRFQATADIDAAAGAWLRCLAHSRAQEQDGVVMAGWLRRAFATTYERVEELVKVGLLTIRADGDYEIHAYAPRNQTRDMIADDRTATRERVRAWRRSGSQKPAVTRYNSVTSAVVTIEDGGLTPSTGQHDRGSSAIHESEGSHATIPRDFVAAIDPSDPPRSTTAFAAPESREKSSEYEESGGQQGLAPGAPVTRYTNVTSDVVTGYENVSNALVPTSTSINSSSLSSSLTSSSFPLSSEDLRSGAFSRDNVRAVPRASAPPPAPEDRRPLPASERSFAGPFWLAAFTDGIRQQTGRPCTGGRMYLETLERIVTHHAPERDPARASDWLKDQAKAFAAQWDGKHPAKGLTPDGLERWLNEGRRPPPVFGRPRIVQPPAEQWHEDDWSDLGATVGE